MTSYGPYFDACRAGDVESLRRQLAADPALARSVHADSGFTGLHAASEHPAAIRLLLEHGADPHAREKGDNALPVHFAAARGPLDAVRALLDGGSDVQGEGDDHRMDVIGWACIFGDVRLDVVDLLLDRGAKHHAFSAIACGDRDALRALVGANPGALQRRLSKHEQEQTPLHYTVAAADGLVGGTFRTGDHYQTLELLVELGAELDARDARGRTALEVAMLRGDRKAMRILHRAGAKLPEPNGGAGAPGTLAASMKPASVMLSVPDIASTVRWYESIGFELTGSHGEDGKLDFAAVHFGNTEIMFTATNDISRRESSAVSLWITTDRLDEYYGMLRHRQLERARAELSGQIPAEPAAPLKSDLYTACYGQREFCVRDPNGIELNFCQPVT